MSSIYIQHTVPSAVRIWQFITRYTAECGLPPSQREIAAAVWLSRAAVPRYIDYLANVGVIRRVPNVSRGVVLTVDAPADVTVASFYLKFRSGEPRMTRGQLRAMLADCDTDTLAQIELYLVCLSHGLPHELIPVEDGQ